MKVGSIVELKSGGPEMTITGQTGIGEFTCRYWDGKEFAVAYFPPEALTLSDSAGQDDN